MKVERTTVASRPRHRGAHSAISLSVIMPTTSWTGTFERCAGRVIDLVEAAGCDAEFIVVHDGRAARPPAWLRRRRVRVMGTRAIGGPAIARNRAADRARGEVLFFVDADVELSVDAVERVRAAFASDASLVAMFGAYDDEPAATGAVSQFRNLLHHHTHVAHPGRAGTFWSGCGAVRAAHFQDVGGFDERYVFPSVEDIELGMRLRAEGGRILLDPLLQGKHHKNWSLRSMVVTDICSRAVPWTRLIVRSGRLPAELNIDWKNRISGLLAVAAVASGFAAAILPAAGIAAVACVAGVLALNLDFYLLCLRQRGPAFAAVAAMLHLLFFVYSSGTFATVVLADVVRRWALALWRLPGPAAARPAASGNGGEEPAMTLQEATA